MHICMHGQSPVATSSGCIRKVGESRLGLPLLGTKGTGSSMLCGGKISPRANCDFALTDMSKSEIPIRMPDASLRGTPPDQEGDLPLGIPNTHPGQPSH